ncbi:TPA: hypothetical protein H1009_02230 [archaeon]|nr:hypothetical protein [Candidatus Naiadarchaeales archaeon SRR2090153.bin461]
MGNTTTIQIRETVKHELERLKGKSHETYEDVILKLIGHVEKEKRLQKELLIEGYKEMAEESRRTAKEWAAADSKWD